MLNRIQQYVSWDRLAAIGNSPVAKATIFVPLLGQALIYSETWLLNNIISGPSLKLLYVALLCISAAQLIFVCSCPKIIKTFPTREKFLLNVFTAYTYNDYLDIKIIAARLWIKDEFPKLSQEKAIQLIEHAKKCARHDDAYYNQVSPNQLFEWHRVFTMQSDKEISISQEKCVIGILAKSSKMYQIGSLSKLVRDDFANTPNSRSAMDVCYKIMTKAQSRWRVIAGILYGLGISYLLFQGAYNILRALLIMI